jgi:uncharacterized OsmC-like protein
MSNELKLIVYFEKKLNDLVIIKNNLKTKLTSALLNNNEDYSSPKELFCLSLMICFYKTTKSYLSLEKKTIEDIKVKVLCDVKKDKLGFYFKIDLFLGINNFSLEEIKKIMNLVHKKCPISRMLSEYKELNLIPYSYNEIL